MRALLLYKLFKQPLLTVNNFESLFTTARIYSFDSGLSLWKCKDGELPITARGQCQRQNKGCFCVKSTKNVFKTSLIHSLFWFALQNGYTPLHQAAQQGNTHVINVLLQHGAKPNTTTMVRMEMP